MFCGTRSFSQTDGERSPKSSKLKHSLSMNYKKKQSRSQNPYSTTGLDKFEKILAELDARKEKIKLQAKSQEDATVRFTYRYDSEDWIPIIIKKRELPKVGKRLSAPRSFKVEKEVIKESSNKEAVKQKGKEERKMIKKRSYSWGDCYWGSVIVLILVLLIFGRSFAICWTSILWYLIPMMNNYRRKEFGRRHSDKGLGGGCVHGLKSPRGHVSGKR